MFTTYLWATFIAITPAVNVTSSYCISPYKSDFLNMDSVGDIKNMLLQYGVTNNVTIWTFTWNEMCINSLPAKSTIEVISSTMGP